MYYLTERAAWHSSFFRSLFLKNENTPRPPRACFFSQIYFRRCRLGFLEMAESARKFRVPSPQKKISGPSVQGQPTRPIDCDLEARAASADRLARRPAATACQPIVPPERSNEKQGSATRFGLVHVDQGQVHVFSPQESINCRLMIRVFAVAIANHWSAAQKCQLFLC